MPDSDSMTAGKEIKDYLDRRFSHESPLIHSIRRRSIGEKLPDIQISLHLGKLLYILAKIQDPSKILEIGTLGGYSTAWIAEALKPQAEIISLEINLENAKKARRNLNEFQGKNIEVRVGHAVELLAHLFAEGKGPFDFIFIDADKENNVLYLEWSIHLSRSGTMILIDNLIPKGHRVGYPWNQQAEVVYEFNDYLAQHPLVETVALPTLVGLQGRLDALALVRVK